MFARIENGRVVEIVPAITIIAEETIVSMDEDSGVESETTVQVTKQLFHESLVFVPCPDETECGMVFNEADSTFSEYVPPAPDWSDVKRRRDQLLLQSDWVGLADAPLTVEEKALWFAYRQALRNIPQNFTLSQDVIWPEQPE